MRSDVEVVGLAALSRDFSMVREKLHRKEMAKVLRPGARIFVKEVRRRTPKRKGYLRRALTIKLMKGKPTSVFTNLGVDFLKKTYPWKNGPVRPFYAIMVHNGTVATPEGQRRKHRAMSHESRIAEGGRERIKPNPFVYEAFMQSCQRVANKILSDLEQKVRQL